MNIHLAVIMDGNGRWAVERGLPRLQGHRAGARAVRRIVETAARQGIDVLTLYAFSGDNWARPPGEVRSLMTLFKNYLLSECSRCVTNNVRVNVIGRRDRLDVTLLRIIEDVEKRTAAGTGLLLRLAVDYSARDSLVAAACRTPRQSERNTDLFRKQLEAVTNTVRHVPDVDLLVRTGGERRLSDFLLFECAYAELLFLDKAWPDYRDTDLLAALEWFKSRHRRFGRVEYERNPRRAPKTGGGHG